MTDKEFWQDVFIKTYMNLAKISACPIKEAAIIADSALIQLELRFNKPKDES